MHRSLRKENSVGTPLSRQRLHDKERAVNAARNAGESKFGNTLVNGHTQEDKNYKRQLEKLKAEMRRKQAHIEQQKKQFVQKISQLPDPTILVERPPSPHYVRKALYDEEFDHYWSDIYTPGYMRNTRSTFKYPSTLPTIDAYVLRPKRKVNLWEDTAQEAPKVTNVYVPHTPLTPQEEAEIQRCHATYLRRPRTVEDILHPGDSDQTGSALVPVKQQKQKKRAKTLNPKKLTYTPKQTELSQEEIKSESTENSEQSAESSSTTFITELPKENYARQEETSTEEPKPPEEANPEKQTFPRIRRKSVAPKPPPPCYSPHKVFVIVEGDENGTELEPDKTIGKKGDNKGNRFNSKPEMTPLSTQTEGPIIPVLPPTIDSRTQIVSSNRTEQKLNNYNVTKSNNDTNSKNNDSVDDDEAIYEVGVAQISDSQMVKGPEKGKKTQGILEMVTEGYSGR